MTRHIVEEPSTVAIDRHPFVIPGSMMPPRDPEDDEDDENADDEGERTDEPPVVREPDEE
jgi:hypothetical protein